MTEPKYDEDDLAAAEAELPEADDEPGEDTEADEVTEDDDALGAEVEEGAST